MPETLPLRRRANVERRVLAMLLKQAARHGFTVLPTTTPYIGPDEQRLLAWTAEIQRIVGHSGTLPSDPTLLISIARWASMLESFGLRLSPLTLYSARLRDRA